MQYFLFWIGLLFLGGCYECCDLDRCAIFECGNPCRELRPLEYPVSTLLQAYGDSAIGKAIPSRNRVFAAQAMQSILKYGAPGEVLDWESPDETVSGRIQVFKAHPGGIVSCQGIYCRAYVQEIETEDDTYIAQGKACEDIYHIWRIVQEAPYASESTLRISSFGCVALKCEEFKNSKMKICNS